jgi:hypothetical protein
MRSKLLAFTALVTLAALVADADARRRPQRQAKSFQANKTFGLGIMFGNPTGLSGKYYLGADTALDFGVGAYYGYGRYYRRGLHIHGDFLWHPVVLASPDPFELPLYFGVGVRILEHDRFFGDGRYRRTHVGIRGPIGILMDFNRVPIDIFFELALVLDFITGDRYSYFDLNAAVGFRYYF